MRIFLLALLAAGGLMAQSHGYVFVAPGVASGGNNTAGLVHLGVGGEGVLPMGIGAGLNYWYKDHLGIKLEVRDHFSTGTNPANYLEFRFGFDFK